MQDGIKSRFWFGTAQVLEADQKHDAEWYGEKLKRFEHVIPDIGASWFVGQYERGEQGRAHLQFAIYFSNARKRKVVGEMDCWDQPPHLEPAKGTAVQIAAYCGKEDGRIAGPIEVGVRPMQGNRTDLHDIYRELRTEGKSIVEVADSYPGQFMRCGRMFANASLFFRPPAEKRWFILLYGPTGTGKSRNARSILHGEPYYNHGGFKWWDGYQGERNVVFDDFSWEGAPAKELLRLGDWDPAMVQTKGGHIHHRSKWFIFTSNEAVEEWYEGGIRPGTRAALEGRFKYIIYIGTDVVVFDKGNEQDFRLDGFNKINDF